MNNDKIILFGKLMIRALIVMQKYVIALTIELKLANASQESYYEYVYIIKTS